VAKSYKQYLKEQREFYINKSKKLESNIKDFKENIRVTNKLSGESYKLKHDFMQVSLDNYLWFVYNQKMLETKIMEDGNYVALFLTLTLDSSFHLYSKTTKKLNPSYKDGNSIHNGYKLLNSSFREIYKNFRVKRTLEKIFYSRAIEPHKNLTPHLHAIIYVKKEYVDNLINHIQNIIKKNSLGRYEIEVIKDLSRSTSYLLKYINKSTNPKNKDDYHFFSGWKKTHKIRVFTISNLGLERYLFKKINHHLNLTKGLKNENPIKKILDVCDILVATKDDDTNKLRFKEYSNDEALYRVRVNRVRKVKVRRVSINDKIVKDNIEKVFSNDYYKRLLLHCNSTSNRLALQKFGEMANEIVEDIKTKRFKQIKKARRLIKDVEDKSEQYYEIDFDKLDELEDIDEEVIVERKIYEKLMLRYSEYIRQNRKNSLEVELKPNRYEYVCGDEQRFLDIFSFDVRFYKYKVEQVLITTIENNKKIYDSRDYKVEHYLIRKLGA